MREKQSRFHFSLSAWLAIIIAIIIAFAFQEHYAKTEEGVSWIENYLALSPDGLRHGFVWQLITFQFLHGNLTHLFLNAFGIWVFGRIMEQQLGAVNFLKVYFAGGIIGGVLQALGSFLFPYHFGYTEQFGWPPVVGASAGICAVMAAFAMMAPDAKLLLWLIIPVRAKYLLIGSIAMAVFFIIKPWNPGVAHAAHLGGLLTGIAFMRWQLYVPRQRNLRPFQEQRRKRELVKAAAMKNIHSFNPKPSPEELPPEEFISREVDPILDKISAHGIQSLTDHERKILELARKKMEH